MAPCLSITSYPVHSRRITIVKYVMLIHEIHVSELQLETNFQAFLTTT